MAIFTFSKNLELGNASTDDKCHFAIALVISCNINVYAKDYQNNPLSSRDRAIFTFQNLELGKASINDVISQSLGLDLVNIDVYGKFHHNIPLSSGDRAIFTFSEFEARQSHE